jgi:hypothetical protein
MFLIASMEICSPPHFFNLEFSKMSTVLFRDTHGKASQLIVVLIYCETLYVGVFFSPFLIL